MADDQRRAVEQPDDLGAIVGVKHRDLVTSLTVCLCRRPPGLALADDDDLGVTVAHAHLWVMMGHRCRWCPEGRMTLHRRCSSGGLLAGAHPGDAIDDGHTIAAIPGQTQGAAMGRVKPVAQGC